MRSPALVCILAAGMLVTGCANGSSLRKQPTSTGGAETSGSQVSGSNGIDLPGVTGSVTAPVKQASFSRTEHKGPLSGLLQQAERNCRYTGPNPVSGGSGNLDKIYAKS